MEGRLKDAREKFRVLSGKLDSLSPLKTIERGYSITLKGSEPINSITQVDIGDVIRSRLSDGIILSQVKRTMKEGEQDG